MQMIFQNLHNTLFQWLLIKQKGMDILAEGSGVKENRYMAQRAHLITMAAALASRPLVGSCQSSHSS